MIKSHSWHEMFNLDSFNAFMSTYKGNENTPYLPRMLLNMVNNQTKPVMAQFDYRWGAVCICIFVSLVFPLFVDMIKFGSSL